jgi:selenocysteine lyase/cysteine desulfurase
VAALGVDYLAAGSHKWLMGCEGCGFLYAAPERAARLRPVTAGWLGHAPDGLRFLFDGAGHLRYDRGFRGDMAITEAGVSNAAGLAALHTAVRILRHLGVAAIAAHIGGWLDRLEGPLVERGFVSRRMRDPARRSGILSVVPPPGAELRDLTQALAAAGVSATTPDGHLRFAPHWPNDASTEVPLVLEAIDVYLQRAR